MEIRHFRYFLAVARHRNFTRAAEQLDIAPPTLSRQIQDMGVPWALACLSAASATSA